MTQTKTQPSQGKNKMAKKRRRRKKGGGGNNNSVAVMTLQPGEVPTDEQLEAEAKALEKELDAKTQKKFDDAKKDGLDLTSLQALSGSELADIAKKEKIADATSLSKQKLVFEILKSRAEKHGLMMGEGTLEISCDGFEPPNPADLNGDGIVDASDLGLLFSAWNTPDADLDGDGTTNAADVGLLIAAWS